MDTNVIPKRPTSKQDWPLDDRAQMTEKRRFQALLFDLCKGLQDPPEKKGRPGPKRLPLRDRVFASTLKVDTTFRSHRFACDLEDAHEKGYLSRLMHSVRVRVCAFLESASMTPVLHALIVRSSLPLRAVETTFAPDSTGFSTSRFVRWFDEKCCVQRSGHDWVKAHALGGVKTNLVTAVPSEGRDANDCPQFKPLVEKTTENCTAQEVPADKAYLAHDNLALVEGIGGTAYVPFQVNSIQGEAGSLWEKLFLYDSFRREEFLKHSHLRSNAESTFAMLKAKFRDHVRSKTDVAMKKEVLCKFLCHNLCVVHQSHVEVGMEPVFWQNEAAPENLDVLPLVRPG